MAVRLSAVIKVEEEVESVEEWLALGALIRDAEADLRRVGKLPPVPNFAP